MHWVAFFFFFFFHLPTAKRAEVGSSDRMEEEMHLDLWFSSWDAAVKTDSLAVCQGQGRKFVSIHSVDSTT